MGRQNTKAIVVEDAQGRRQALDACHKPCTIEQGMRIIGGKWTASILWHLKDDSVRFNDLARMIGGASKKMIADRLKHLEQHGMIDRQVQETSPVSVVYSLTPLGETALGFLDQLRQWTEDLPRQVSTSEDAA